MSCSWGYTTTGGAKGVGESTTSAVVISLVLIFVFDFALRWARLHAAVCWWWWVGPAPGQLFGGKVVAAAGATASWPYQPAVPKLPPLLPGAGADPKPPEPLPPLCLPLPLQFPVLPGPGRCAEAVCGIDAHAGTKRGWPHMAPCERPLPASRRYAHVALGRPLASPFLASLCISGHHVSSNLG